MNHPASPPHAREARLAVSALFLVNGAGMASVLPRLPAVKEALGLSNAELGLAVAAMPVGGLIAGGLVGLLIARFGSGRTAAVAGILETVCVAGIGLAPSWAMLALVYLVAGAFDATMDAAMNSHGLAVERQYRRSILQGLHGVWSLGGMAGGAAGAVAAGLGVPVSLHLAVVAVALAVVVAAVSRGLLPASVADVHMPVEGIVEPIHVRNLPRLLRVLAPIAMLGVLCSILQGTAATWSAVFLADVLRLSAGVAAVGFVVYMASMTLGRLTNDRWIDRYDGVRVVRAGAVIGATGVVLVMISGIAGVPSLAFAGFAAIGFGSSPMFPVMVAAAGTRAGIPSGYGVALASWLVRFGLMLAPAAVGVAADAAGLGAAFLIPLAAALAVVAFAVPLTGGRAGRARTAFSPPA